MADSEEIFVLESENAVLQHFQYRGLHEQGNDGSGATRSPLVLHSSM
jgi:hypothetical protein